MNSHQFAKKRATMRFSHHHEPEEGFSWLSERETSAQTSDKEMESYEGEDEVVIEGEYKDDEEEKRGSDEDKSDSDEKVIESTLGSPRDDHPFIFPKEWTINDFLPDDVRQGFQNFTCSLPNYGQHPNPSP